MRTPGETVYLVNRQKETVEGSGESTGSILAETYL